MRSRVELLDVTVFVCWGNLANVLVVTQALRSRYLDRHVNTSRQWLYVDGTVTKCPFTGGVLVGVGLFGKI